MCGIAGVITDKSFDAKMITSSILESLKHRGPDDEGTFLSQAGAGLKILLAHTRLSIIDLTEAAHQPISNETNRIHLIYNGEIYNYQALRKDLRLRGHHLKSTSDSEVLVHLYEEKPEFFLQDLRGMFAFALWDADKERLLLARDRFGIKPLYYYWDGSTFLFASDVHTILRFGMIKAELDETSLFQYLKFGSVACPKTIYKNIFCLEPAHYLVLQNQRLIKKKYWNLAEFFSQDKIIPNGEDELIASLREQLRDSVRSHVVSDVPVGVFLSGGIDSSSIVSLLNDSSGNRVTTISAIFPDTPYDESSFAKEIAQRFGNEHIEVKIPKSDIPSFIEEFLTHIDQPTIDGLNVYLVARAAKQVGLKVCLSGLGADELFGGYPSFSEVPRLHKFVKGLNLLGVPKYLLSLSGNNKLHRIYDMFNPPSLANVYLNFRGLFSNEEISQLLDVDKGEVDSNFSQFDADDVRQIRSAQERVSYFELSRYMANQLLRDSDVFGMCHPVEIRVPFVDHKLFEFVARIPDKYKYQSRPNKHFLIKAVGNLPAQIYQRPKRGFTLPLDLWLRNELNDQVREKLLTSNLLDKKFLQALLDNFYNRKVHWSRIWTLFILSRVISEKHTMYLP